MHHAPTLFDGDAGEPITLRVPLVALYIFQETQMDSIAEALKERTQQLEQEQASVLVLHQLLKWIHYVLAV